MPGTPQPEPVNISAPGKKPLVTAIPRAEFRRLGRQGAYTRWSRVADRKAATRAAREARFARFYAEADAQGVTDPVVREQMARAAQKAEMIRLRGLQLAAKRQALAQALARGGDAA